MGKNTLAFVPNCVMPDSCRNYWSIRGWLCRSRSDPCSFQEHTGRGAISPFLMDTLVLASSLNQHCELVWLQTMQPQSVKWWSGGRLLNTMWQASPFLYQESDFIWCVLADSLGSPFLSCIWALSVLWHSEIVGGGAAEFHSQSVVGYSHTWPGLQSLIRS